MRSNLLKNALSVSFESADPTENEEMNPVTEETTVVVDEVLEEVRDAEENVEQHEEAVSELEEVADSMESLIASLESAVEQGGMNPQAAGMYNLGLSITTRRLPIDMDNYVISTESFGGTGDKLVATMESLEKARNFFANLWKTIRTAIENAIRAVVNFVKTLGTSAVALKRAAAVLRNRAGQISGKSKEGYIDGVAVNTALSYNSTGIVAGETVVRALSSVVTGGEGVVYASMEAAEQLKKVTKITVSDGQISLPAGGIDYDAINKHFGVEGRILPGGMTVRIGKDGKSASFVNAYDKKQDFKHAKVAVAGSKDLNDIAKGIDDIAKMITDFSGKEFKKLENEVHKAIKEQDAVVKKVDAAGDKKIAGVTVKQDSGKAEFRKALSDFDKTATMIRSVGPKYMSYAAKCAKAAYSYGMKSAAQYGG